VSKITYSLAVLICVFFGSILSVTANASAVCDAEYANLYAATANELILVPFGPTVGDEPAAKKERRRQKNIRRQLTNLVWQSFWEFSAGSAIDADETLAAYQYWLDVMPLWGMLDLSAAGQPDFASLVEDVESCIAPDPLTTGLHSIDSAGAERTYYVQLPADYDASGTELKPLIIGFHGSFASHQSWVGPNERYGFVPEVGDGAVMVFPDAAVLPDGQINWSFETDFLFFEDILAELDRRGLQYDRNKLFVTGHSSGAGMAHEVGCLYGDIVRAIAISSGSLISGGSCVGSVGVIQTQGEADLAVPINTGAAANNFWTLYNGHDPSTSIPGVVSQCVDYSALGLPGEAYPVQWCQHTGGHAWTSFNSGAFWAFFSGLADAAPTVDHPPGGGNEAALGDFDTTLTFTLQYPESFPPITSGAISLYPDDYADGQFRSPSVFLNTDWNPNTQAPGGVVTQGSTVTYNLVPIKFFVFGGEFDVSASYKLQFSIYVDGGSRPIPTPGLDLKVLLPIDFVDITTPIVIPEILLVEPVVPW
jgi:polyhydroxybutyrate depolymerase